MPKSSVHSDTQRHISLRRLAITLGDAAGKNQLTMFSIFQGFHGGWARATGAQRARSRHTIVIMLREAGAQEL